MKKEKTKFMLTYRDLKRENFFLKMVVATLLLSMFYAIALASKDPLVIRQTENDVQIIDAESSTLNEYDVEIFLRHFVNNLNLYDSYKLNDAYLALNMMNAKLQHQFISDVFQKEQIEEIKSKKVTTNTTYQEISFEQQGDKIKCVVVYTRERQSFLKKEIPNKVIRLDLMLTILESRTKNMPYGLLVEEYKRTKLG